MPAVAIALFYAARHDAGENRYSHAAMPVELRPCLRHAPPPPFAAFDAAAFDAPQLSLSITP